ncbi:UNVERIFIED_CONTAM: hypothetical protein HDU68_012006 [Siphonaria sp. JEL0065]|nr:hypothetical protein HDU68_012006 [Siphonaria sp. JEL0065]
MSRSSRNTPATPKTLDLMKGGIQGSIKKLHEKPSPRDTQSKSGSSGGLGSVGVLGSKGRIYASSGVDKFFQRTGSQRDTNAEISSSSNDSNITIADVDIKTLSDDLSNITLTNPIVTSSTLVQQPHQQPEPVPPPTTKSIGFFKHSSKAFPGLSRPSSAASSGQTAKITPKRSSSNTLDKINAFRVSASDFFTSFGSAKKRGFSADPRQQTAQQHEDTGGEASEEIVSSSASGTSQKPHMSSKHLAVAGAAVVGGLQRIGSAISGSISRATVSSGRSFVVKSANSFAPLEKQAQQPYTHEAQPPKSQQQSLSKQQLDYQLAQVKKVKMTQKEKEDEERNSRHADVVRFLNGTWPLSAEFTKNYKLGEVLGDGAFGFVMTATSFKDNKEVAVKFITRDKIPRELWVKDPSNPKERIPIEIAILQEINHPNIIKYIGHVVEPTKYILLITELHGSEWVSSQLPSQPPATDDTNKGGPSMIAAGSIVAEKKRAASTGYTPAPNSPPVVAPLPKMECSPLFRLTPEQEKQIRRRTSCDLFECIDAHKRIPEPLAKKIFAQIALAVNFLHTHDLVHRDLKDENIVIDSNYNIKLIDFGSAAHIPKTEREYFTKFNGTTHFASPEIANQLSYRGPESEMWSLGVLLYTIVFGENPFHTIPDIIRGEYRMPFGLESDNEMEGCRHLIKRLLTYNPRERITIDEARHHIFRINLLN